MIASMELAADHPLLVKFSIQTLPPIVTLKEIKKIQQSTFCQFFTLHAQFYIENEDV